MELYTVDHGARYDQLRTLWLQLDEDASESRGDDEHEMLGAVHELLLQHPGR